MKTSTVEEMIAESNAKNGVATAGAMLEVSTREIERTVNGDDEGQVDDMENEAAAYNEQAAVARQAFPEEAKALAPEPKHAAEYEIAKPAEPKKWTNTAGPIQSNKVKKALQSIQWEGRTYTEKTGVIGGKEHSWSYTQIYGGQRSDSNEALDALGEQFAWQVTRENHQAIITAAAAALEVLIKNRPVNDKRITKEQDAEQAAAAALVDEKRERAEAMAEMPTPVLGERWAGCAVQFRTDIKAIAAKARLTAGEVFLMWIAYADANRDQSCILSEFLQLRKAELTPGPIVRVTNRGQLRRLAEEGRLELVGSSHYDEQMGSSNFKGLPIPVRMAPEAQADRQEGICYLYESDFTGNSGRCSQGDTGIVHLRVHSNSSYTFRVKSAPAGENTPSGLAQDAPESTGATGIVVRRNLAKAGVEISFPGKPSRETLDRLKAAGFRWGFHAKVWYKKFGSYSWAQAHEIAGIPLAPSGASAAMASSEVDAFDRSVEDRMSEQCGLTGTHD